MAEVIAVRDARALGRHRSATDRVSARAQVALQETFAQPPAPPPAHATTELPSLLREANLETASVAADSPAAGKLIRELELRTRTGASIVGIERGGANIINPGPHEELVAGDQVLLLGTRPQRDAAKAILAHKSPAT